MSLTCQLIHEHANRLPRFHSPFPRESIPRNGIYFVFEQGELAHGGDRIVRIGTHTGENQLYSRLRQHFEQESKDRSIFRKNIGRSLLNKNHNPLLRYWEYDLTSRQARTAYFNPEEDHLQQQVEKQVSTYLREHVSIAVIPVDEASQRLIVEARLIASVATCTDCAPSANWLGQHSPKEKIRQSGLWLVNELKNVPFTETEVLHVFPA